MAVDDAHLLDDLSAFVVHQIVQRRAARVVLTVCDGEPVPDGVQDVWRGGQFQRLDLQPLSPEETATLLSATLGGPMDADAAARLWKLTGGNILYLCTIVEQEVAEGRLSQRHGYWSWTGEPIISKGLVELIEARFGALSQPVGEVIDALAVGEPLDMTTLRRIAVPDAIEEADVRGLITVDQIDDGIEVRLAHPLYGEVRRFRSPETRLRRLRGQVAAELAWATGSDDMRNVVRRATLCLDSDLTPDTELLLTAASGAVWLGDLRLANRLAKAAIRVDAAPRAYFLRAHALRWLFAGQEADAVLAELCVSELTDYDRGRLAYLRALNTLWALGDALRAKDIIDDAARNTSPPARIWIVTFLTAYWFALDQPQQVDTGIEKPCAGRPAGRRRRRDRMGACRDVRGHRTDHQSGGRRQDGIRRCVAVLRLPAHAIQHHRRARQRTAAGGPDGGWTRGGTTSAGAECRDAGKPTCSAPQLRVEPRCSLVVLTRRVPCRDRQRPHCRRRGWPSAGDTGITFRTPLRWRCGARPTRRPRCSPRSISDVHFASWITSAAWPAHGWRLGRAPSPRRSARCWQQPKPQRPTGNSRQN